MDEGIAAPRSPASERNSCCRHRDARRHLLTWRAHRARRCLGERLRASPVPQYRGRVFAVGPRGLRRRVQSCETSRWIKTIQGVPPWADRVSCDFRPGHVSAQPARLRKRDPQGKTALRGGRPNGVGQELLEIKEVERFWKITGRAALKCFNRNRRRIVAGDHENRRSDAHFPQRLQQA
jgi:hypothetical protein